MHLSTLVALVASLAAVTAASPSLLPFRHDYVIVKRELSPGAKRCHKSCGYTIMGAAKEGYCEDPAWKALLDACRECAPKYDNIESNYAKDLDAAVKPCNLDAVSSATADQPASAAPTSTPEARSSAGRESSAAVNATSTAVSSVAGGITLATSSPEAGATQAKASTSARPSPSAVNDAPGSRVIVLGPVVAAFALLFAAAML